MLSESPGRALFFAWNKSSFYSLFSLDKTGQIMALACSWPGEVEMPREVK
jgi:hypothetical protein